MEGDSITFSRRAHIEQRLSAPASNGGGCAPHHCTVAVSCSLQRVPRLPIIEETARPTTSPDTQGPEVVLLAIPHIAISRFQSLCSVRCSDAPQSSTRDHHHFPLVLHKCTTLLRAS